MLKRISKKIVVPPLELEFPALEWYPKLGGPAVIAYSIVTGEAPTTNPEAYPCLVREGYAWGWRLQPRCLDSFRRGYCYHNF
jgi:hypothetical protein